MIAELKVVPLRPLVDVRCSDPYCRTLLLRYRPPADGVARGFAEQELRCPNRRCRRLQWVKVPVGTVTLPPPVGMRED